MIIEDGVLQPRDLSIQYKIAKFAGITSKLDQMKFSDIPGHESVKQQLRNLVADDNIPHALLLEGPQGIGKLMMARVFAQYVHCTNRQDGEPCGCCPSCLQHQSFNHIDVHYVYPVVKGERSTPPISADYAGEWHEFLKLDPYASPDRWTTFFDKKNAQPTVYVTESNELVRILNYTTHGARFKMVIFWLPEKMEEATANKLLKILEEPFPDTIFIMTSNSPSDILPTIYSRLRRVGMRRLSDDVITDYLVGHESLDPVDAKAIAHLAGGSITAALSQIKLNDAAGEYLDLFIQLMRSAYQRKVKDLREWANKVESLGREREVRFYEYAQRLIRENFLYNFGDGTLVYMNRPETAFSTRFARFIHERNAEDLCRVMNDAMTDIAGNANGKIVNLDLAIKVIFLLKS